MTGTAEPALAPPPPGPASALAPSEQAQIAVALRDWKTARVLYRHYLERAPDDVDAKLNFATALMNGEGDFACRQ